MRVFCDEDGFEKAFKTKQKVIYKELRYKKY